MRVASYIEAALFIKKLNSHTQEYYLQTQRVRVTFFHRSVI